MKIKTFIFLIAMTLISACATSPTGRHQVMLYSSSEMDKLGTSSFEEMKQKEKISSNMAATQFVQCVADEITRNVPKKIHDGTWEVVLFDSPQVNAFALPGGKIGVYTGLLKVTDNQNQLAAVIGHEVGHVIAHHANERLSSGSLVNTGLQVADAMMSSGNVANKNLYMQGLGLGAQYGVLMPYGRAHESEADLIGEDLMAKSGFNPEASIDLWHNMMAQTKGEPPEFLSTHPSHETRIQDLQKHMKKAEALYAASQQKPSCVKPEQI